MSNFINAAPTDIRRTADRTAFYYGASAGKVKYLPAKAEFSVVYSPREDVGWEYVHYRVFDLRNGVCVVERRALTADEQAYFEALLAKSKMEPPARPSRESKDTNADMPF